MEGEQSVIDISGSRIERALGEIGCTGGNRQPSMVLSGVEKRRSDFSLPVAIGQIFTWPPQSGLTWFCFLFPLIELDRRVSRIQLSEKVSRGRPRKAACPISKLGKAQPLMQDGPWKLLGCPPS